MNEEEKTFLHLIISFNDDDDNTFANLCLIACCEKKEWSSMFWIYETFIYPHDPEKHNNPYHFITDLMYFYMIKLICEDGNVQCLNNLEKKLWWYNESITNIEQYYNMAFKKNHIPILLVLSNWYPKNIYIFHNFHYHYDCFFVASWNCMKSMFRQQKRNKQLFLLWLASNQHSPNKQNLLYRLPHHISKYLIQQFVC